MGYFYDEFNGYKFTILAQSRISVDEGEYYEVKIVRTYDTVNKREINIHEQGLFIVDSRDKSPEELQEAYELVKERAKEWAEANDHSR